MVIEDNRESLDFREVEVILERVELIQRAQRGIVALMA